MRAGFMFAMSAVLLLGCAMDEEPTEDVTPDSGLDGEGTEPVDPEPVPERAANEICGDATVASTRAQNGNRIVYCVIDGAEVVGELAPIGRPSAVEDLELELADTDCALDVFLATTEDDVPVPSALVASCEAKIGAAIDALGRPVIDQPVFAANPDDDAGAGFVPVANYCGSSGPSQFFAEQCAPLYSSNAPRYTVWCQSGAATWHQKTLGIQMGGDGNLAIGRVASCNGTTRWEALRRTNNWESWAPMVVVDVPSGWSWNTWMSHNPSIFDPGSDFRFRGDSYGSAWHRYAGRFEDIITF